MKTIVFSDVDVVIVLLDFLEYCIAAFNEIKSLSRMISISSSSSFFWDKFSRMITSFIQVSKKAYTLKIVIEGEEHLFNGREIYGGQQVLTGRG